MSVIEWPGWIQSMRKAANAQGGFDHGLIDAMRRGGMSDDELVAFLTEHYATTEGQAEMAESGFGGRDAAEVARLIVGGR